MKTPINFFQYPVPRIASEDEKRELISRLCLDRKISNPGVFTLFVSIPFCRSRCNSCLFYKNSIGLGKTQERLLDCYLEKIMRQISYYSKTNRFREAECKAVYVGGGTASLLSPRQLVRLIETIKTSVRLDREVETTFEANPLQLDKKYINEIQGCGINRISVGIQSFDRATLIAVGSPHSASRCLGVLKDVMATGFKTVNVDLLYGVPGQKENQWRADINKVIEFEPQSVTTYKYVIYQGSKAELLIKKGTLGRQKSDDELHGYYLLSSEALRDAGYVEETFGCFVKKGHEQKYRKYSYKLGSEIVGIGAGAYSYINGYFILPSKNARKYMSDIESGVLLTVEKISTRATFENRIERYTIHNLFAGIINRSEFAEIFGHDILIVLPNIFEEFEEQGLVNIQEGSIEVTELGKRYIKDLMCVFYSDDFKSTEF